MTPVRHIHSRTVLLAHENIDTDRIIPARFLTTTTRAGLGRHAFQDWRYRSDGTPDPEFVLNRPEAMGAAILVAGRNFGGAARAQVRDRDAPPRGLKNHRGIGSQKRIAGDFLAADHAQNVCR